MPGISSGLAPAIVNATPSATADAYVNVAKFPTVHTVTDAFYAISGTITANTTDFIRFRMINGKTTGTGTTNLAVAAYSVGGASVAWTANTAKAITTNYTFSANHWLNVRYSEDGTAAVLDWTACFWAVNGNV